MSYTTVESRDPIQWRLRTNLTPIINTTYTPTQKKNTTTATTIATATTERNPKLHRDARFIVTVKTVTLNQDQYTTPMRPISQMRITMRERERGCGATVLERNPNPNPKISNSIAKIDSSL